MISITFKQALFTNGVDLPNFDNEIRKGHGTIPALPTNLDGVSASNSAGTLRVAFVTDMTLVDHQRLYGASHLPVLGIQTDATLDPGDPATGDRYIVTDSANLHANFGSMPGGFADDDVIEWNGASWDLAVDVDVVDNVVVYDTTNQELRGWESGAGSWAIVAAGGLIAIHDHVHVEEAQSVKLAGSEKVIGAPIVAMAPRPSTVQYIDVTHNWCDKTTWWPSAKQETGATLTLHEAADPGTHGGKYRLDNGGSPVPFWIDAMHHKIYREYARHKNKVIKVYDNGTELVVAQFEQTKETAGVDCEIDFVSGLVVFEDGATITGPVTADFWHIDEALSPMEQSKYVMLPPVGYKVLLERVEVQFTQGVEVKDNTVFTAFVPLHYLAIQTDATLDPKVYDPQGAGKLREGMAFLIKDKDNLHANFGTIDGLENGDIVYYRIMRENQVADAFVVWFDASEKSSGSAMNVLLPSTPFPTVSVWNGTAWSAETFGAPTDEELPEARDCYSSFRSYLDDATGNYPNIPAAFSTGDRGCPHGIMQIPFNWLGSKILDSALGVKLCVWLSNGEEFGPDRTHFSTASFYGQIHNGA